MPSNLSSPYRSTPIRLLSLTLEKEIGIFFKSFKIQNIIINNQIITVPHISCFISNVMMNEKLIMNIFTCRGWCFIFHRYQSRYFLTSDLKNVFFTGRFLSIIYCLITDGRSKHCLIYRIALCSSSLCTF